MQALARLLMSLALGRHGHHHCRFCNLQGRLVWPTSCARVSNALKDVAHMFLASHPAARFHFCSPRYIPALTDFTGKHDGWRPRTLMTTSSEEGGTLGASSAEHPSTKSALPMASILVLSASCANARLVDQLFDRICVLGKQQDTVYVLLLGSNLNTLWPSLTQNVLKLVSMVYSASQRKNVPHVHLLCGNVISEGFVWQDDVTEGTTKQTILSVQHILCDPHVCTSAEALKKSLSELFGKSRALDLSAGTIVFLDGDWEASRCNEEEVVPSYANVCLGGTFDGLHQAHRILLTESVLVANERVLVGLTGDELLKTKKFRELIAPGEERRELLIDFLQKALLPRKQLRVEVPLLTEPVGPPGWDPNFQCITLSRETHAAHGSINALRKEKGFPPLAAHLINQGQLLPDPESNAEHAENSQVSSTNLRTRKLGQLLREPDPTKSRVIPNMVVIGLTGGSCSGKSSLCRYLEEDHGAYIVDCDKLGHAAYNESGSPCWTELVREFGTTIVNAKDQSIDRTALGKIVFADPEKKLARLNQIVWPHIGRMVRSQLEAYSTTLDNNSGTPRIAILDAAVLLEAGWEHMCDEIWVVFVPRDVQIKRITERDSKTTEEAEKRLDAQMGNEERILKANVVLSTVYDRHVCRSMVGKAVELLKQRMTKRARGPESKL